MIYPEHCVTCFGLRGRREKGKQRIRPLCSWLQELMGVMRKQDTLTGHKSKQKHEQQTSYSTPTAPAEKRLGWPGKKAWRKWPPDLESLLESNWKIVLSVPSFRVAWGFPSGLHNPAPITCFLQSFPLHDCPPLSPPSFQILRKRPWCWERWKQKEKGVAEDEMVREHHQPNGHKSEQFREVMKHKEVWGAAVHGFTKSWTELSGWTATI